MLIYRKKLRAKDTTPQDFAQISDLSFKRLYCKNWISFFYKQFCFLVKVRDAQLHSRSRIHLCSLGFTSPLTLLFSVIIFVLKSQLSLKILQDSKFTLFLFTALSPKRWLALFPNTSHKNSSVRCPLLKIPDIIHTQCKYPTFYSQHHTEFLFSWARSNTCLLADGCSLPTATMTQMRP